jgi:proline iminopeptidase
VVASFFCALCAMVYVRQIKDAIMDSIKSPLFNDIEPFNSGMLKVSDIHEMYYEESGNKQGLPVVVVHGGPGDSSNPKHRRRFNPEKFRIILFDQRGAGLSTPAACRTENTTQHLVADMEALRCHLNIDKWMVTGSSWGSTLSLVYAQAHPENVLGMVLNGIFLAYKVNNDWIHGPSGAARIFPEAYDRYIEGLTEEQVADPYECYNVIIQGDDKVAAKKAALKVLTYEGDIMAMAETAIKNTQKRQAAEALMTVEEQMTAQKEFEVFAYTHSLLAGHYSNNNYFLEENQILDGVDRLMHIPITLIHGRYDMVCPLKNAYKLHKYLPHSAYIVVENAGHGTGEIIVEVMSAIDDMAQGFVV